ncbi:hypothetical protein THAOC_21949, partial [Thalassiosira oceanica]
AERRSTAGSSGGGGGNIQDSAHDHPCEMGFAPERLRDKHTPTPSQRWHVIRDPTLSRIPQELRPAGPTTGTHTWADRRTPGSIDELQQQSLEDAPPPDDRPDKGAPAARDALSTARIAARRGQGRPPTVAPHRSSRRSRTVHTPLAI